MDTKIFHSCSWGHQKKINLWWDLFSDFDTGENKNITYYLFEISCWSCAENQSVNLIMILIVSNSGWCTRVAVALKEVTVPWGKLWYPRRSVVCCRLWRCAEHFGQRGRPITASPRGWSRYCRPTWMSEGHRKMWKRMDEGIGATKATLTLAWEVFCIPVKVVLKASQTLDWAQVLVRASFPIAGRHAVLGPAQDDSLLAAADLARSHIHT